MSQSPTDTDFAPEDLKRLATLLEKHDLTELRFEQDDVRVTLRTAAYFRQQGASLPGLIPAAVAPTTTEPRADDASGETDEVEPDAPEADGVTIEAPIMGVFYRAASPSDPSFVEVGDAVEVGQVVGLIEAMKVFSEVKAEAAGVVLAIPATNRALVQPGDPLIVLSAE